VQRADTRKQYRTSGRRFNDSSQYRLLPLLLTLKTWKTNRFVESAAPQQYLNAVR